MPPIEQPMRFGNKAFRSWMDKIIAAADEDILNFGAVGNPGFTNFKRAVPELKAYLIDSFGSYERIDYGTGHELNFYVFLYSMCKLGIYGIDDYKVLINCVF